MVQGAVIDQVVVFYLACKISKSCCYLICFYFTFGFVIAFPSQKNGFDKEIGTPLHGFTPFDKARRGAHPPPLENLDTSFKDRICPDVLCD
jgi:hypothetical protein